MIALLATGKSVSEVAQELGTSDTYVRVCRKRAELVKMGLRRSTLTKTGLAPALTPETRRELNHLAALKAAKTRSKRQGRAKHPEKFRAQQDRARQRAMEIHEERIRLMKEQDDMIASSINRRREHVNRILAAWRETA